MDEKDKKEKYIKFLFQLAELPQAFMDLQVYFSAFFFVCLPSCCFVLKPKVCSSDLLECSVTQEATKMVFFG